MNPIKVVTAADQPPVDIDTAKEHLHANKDSAGNFDNTEDASLLLYLDGAVRACENKLQTNIMDTELEMYLRSWPGRCVGLDRYPVSAVNSVKYYDEAGVLQTVSSGMYRVLDFMTPCVLEFTDDFTAPNLHARLYPVVINFNAGFTDAPNVPASIRNAVLLEFAERHENRMTSASPEMQSNAADCLLGPESMWL